MITNFDAEILARAIELKHGTEAHVRTFADSIRGSVLTNEALGSACSSVINQYGEPGVDCCAPVPTAAPLPANSVYAKADGWTLHRGEAVELLNSFDEHSFDLVFADPPYFLSNGGSTCQSGKRVSVNKGDWDLSRGLDGDHSFALEWLKACQRVLKPTGALWVSGTQHIIFNIGFAMQKLGYKLLNTVTWYKPNASPNLACRYFTHSTELLIWASPGSKGKLLHTFNYKDMKEINGGKQMRDVWALPRTGDEELDSEGDGKLWTMTSPKKSEKELGKHPTQKPVALMNRIIEASTSPGDLVLDPFCGSGTTGVAAVSQGRRFVGIDLELEYLELAERRLRAGK